jgi:hypothetical protein
MAILGTRMLKAGTLPGKTVVATVMSNLGLERALAAKGGKLLRTAVGDRYVVEAMRDGGFLLGGEQSGHIIFLDHATTGDGMVAALRVLAVMGTEERTLSELGRAMVQYPQVLLNFAVARKRPLDEMPSVQKVIAQVESDLGGEGRVVVRYSGTESEGARHDRGPGSRAHPRARRGDRREPEARARRLVMIRLYVNVDHIATLRQQRGTRYPDPVVAASLCELAGADGITVHLREDRRHIRTATCGCCARR